MNTIPSDSDRPLRHALGAAIACGFAASVAMWCLWFVLHLPGFASEQLPAAIKAFSLLILQAIFAFLAARSSPRSSLLAGGLAGLVSAAVNLLIMGSILAEQVANRPGLTLPVAAGGSLAQGLIAGLIAGAIAPMVPVRFVRQRWLPHFAALTALAMLPLLLLGGLVTSTRSGLAVPDWPTTNGAMMFLYPLSLMSSSSGVFLEHSHRLFGALTGLTVVVLAGWTLFSSEPKRVKICSALLLALVIAQGVLGGTRVTQQSQVLAMLHGVLAQLVLALAVTIAAWMFWGAQAGPKSKTSRLATAFLHTLFVQLALGAAYRHLAHTHILYTHIALAAAALVLGLLAAGRALSAENPPRVHTLGRCVMAAVILQFLLGWAALGAVMSTPKGPVPTAETLPQAQAVPVWASLTRTAHQANGALLLSAATLLAVAARRK